MKMIIKLVTSVTLLLITQVVKSKLVRTPPLYNDNFYYNIPMQMQNSAWKNKINYPNTHPSIVGQSQQLVNRPSYDLNSLKTNPGYYLNTTNMAMI